MNVLDLIAVLAVCATCVTCFLIRSSHGTDVEDLNETIEQLAAESARKQALIDDLKAVTTSNAKEFAIFRADIRTRLQLGPKS